MVARIAVPLAAAALACAGLRSAPLAPDFVAVWTARVERARGLRFPAPVAARLIDPGGVPPALERELARVLEFEDLERAEWAGRLLGLLPRDADLRRSLLEFGAVGLAGFYSPSSRELYVVGQPGGLLARWLGRPLYPRSFDETVLVHELGHALQDAHSPLPALTLGLRGQDDLAFALGALLEGDAVWTGFRDLELRLGVSPPSSEDYARAMSLEWFEAEYPDVPRALREPILLQYPLGYALVARRAAAGGAAALDALLEDPPLSSEQLLHPERYGERPAFLEPPEAAPLGCQARYRSTLGELGARIWLAERRGAESALAGPAEGWAGDRLLVFDCAAGAAFAWILRFDSVADAREFAVVAEDAAAGLGRGLVEPPRIDADGPSVLVSAGLPESLRARFLEETRARVFPDFDAFLAEHPEVLERARARVRR